MTPEPRPNPDNDGQPETEQIRRCDANLSPDCTDDGQFEVWDGHTLIRLCLPCRRVFENRDASADPRFVRVEGGVPYAEQQVRR